MIDDRFVIIGHLQDSKRLKHIENDFIIASQCYNILLKELLKIENEYASFLGISKARKEVSKMPIKGNRLEKLLPKLKSEYPVFGLLQSQLLQNLVQTLIKDYKLGAKKWLLWHYGRCKAIEQNRKKQDICISLNKLDEYNRIDKKIKKIKNIIKQKRNYNMPKFKKQNEEISSLTYKVDGISGMFLFNEKINTCIFKFPKSLPYREYYESSSNNYVNIISSKKRRCEMLKNNEKTISSCTITKVGNRYRLGIVYKYSRSKHINSMSKSENPENVVGIDLNTADGNYIYTSTNNEYGIGEENYKRLVKNQLQKEKLQSKSDKCVDNSKRHILNKNKQKKHSIKNMNFKKNIFNKLCHEFIINEDIFISIHEDLGLSELKTRNKENLGILKAKGINKHTSIFSLGEFKLCLEEAMNKHNIPIKFIDPKNTSRTCSKCGHIHGPINGKTFICENCNIEIHRDYNAAINIKNKYLINN